MRVCDEVSGADAVRNAASRESEARLDEARGHVTAKGVQSKAVTAKGTSKLGAAIPDARVWSKVELTERSRLRHLFGESSNEARFGRGRSLDEALLLLEFAARQSQSWRERGVPLPSSDPCRMQVEYVRRRVWGAEEAGWSDHAMLARHVHLFHELLLATGSALLERFTGGRVGGELQPPP